MMNNIILNGVNSNTIQGLIIQELPAISKPAIRTEIEEIDGRDGDVITKLGYAAYDKQLSIGLYGNYDINQVISFFNTSGTVIFSNEPDKYYNYQILNEIDFERLVRFRTATVTMHIQPFKYSATETPQTLSGTVITGEGTNINLVNTTDSGLFTDLQIKGDTFQQTYSGKNLLNLTNGTYSNNGVTAVVQNGIITLNGTCSNSTSFVEIPCNSITLNANQTYSFSANNNKVIGTASDPYAAIRLRSSSGDDATTDARFNILNSTKQITKTTNTTYVSVRIRTAVGLTYNNFVIKPQIEVGSTATSYEPYVGGITSPNPDYPQEVKTVTGNNNVTICGKNLFDLSGLIQGGYTDSTFLPSLTNYITVQYIPVQPNTQYTLSSLSLDLTKYIALRVVDFNSSKTFIRRNNVINMNPSTTSVTFTTNNDTYYIALCFYTSQTASVNDLTQGQLEKGTTASEYETYQEQTYTISLGNIELCQINGAYDYIYKNNGNWYLHKATGKVLLNGSENWAAASSINNHYRYVTGLTNATTFQQVICYSNYFLGVTRQAFSNANTCCAINTGAQFLTDDFTTLAAFKTWLSTHNTSVYYLLATPTDTEITDSTLLSQLNALGNATTYAGQTNINTSGDGLSPIMYVETVAVDDPVLRITNSGNTTAKPIITLYGTGTINLSLNGEQIFVIDLSSENYITIDVANMEAYYNGILKNRLVTGNYENFVLNQGENEITFTGTLYSLTISNYSRWI